MLRRITPVISLLVLTQIGLEPLSAQDTPEVRLFVREIRVQGASVLPAADVQRTVYPYLGPGRTLDDVERARAALEALYQENGYQAARVEVPPQQARRGVIFLKVTEGKIGRLRVTGSRYNDIERIRQEAPSLQEGTVPDFDDISRDVVALNQRSNRRITPELKPGSEPGLLDVDLKVEDEAPITASAELNNRYSADTTKLRLNLSASYDNLWQRGHTFGGSLQTTPLDWFDEVMVYSGFYMARFDALPAWTFQASATKQDSNISTLGGVAVAGRGEIYGLRATRVLPSAPGAFHSFSFGIDRKHFTQQVNAAGTATNTPVTYFPISVLYSGAIDRDRSQTDFFVGVTLHMRGAGSDSTEFDLNRFGADPSFVTLRTDFSHTFKLPAGFTLTGRTQGQLASGPLLSNEQFAAGGLDTVRGYLEGETLGDHGILGSLELGSPSLVSGGTDNNTLTVHAFVDGGALILTEPLPAQDSRFLLASYGVGMRLRFFNHLEGSVNVAVPVYDEGKTESGEPFVSFMIKGQL
jgi:hemolysin activation/secretion protein